MPSLWRALRVAECWSFQYIHCNEFAMNRNDLFTILPLYDWLMTLTA